MAESIEQNTRIAPKVTRGLMRKSILLLNMEYKPSELAEELGVTEKTVYKTWLLSGLPFRKDKTGHVWIVGTQARAWLEVIATQSAVKPKQALLSGQGFCLSCRQAVTLENTTKRRWGRAGVLKGTCPLCGNDVRRAIKLTEVLGVEHD